MELSAGEAKAIDTRHTCTHPGNRVQDGPARAGEITADPGAAPPGHQGKPADLRQHSQAATVPGTLHQISEQ